jgi:hypothetical protein
MSTLSYRTKIELGVTAVVIVTGLFFAVLAWDINPKSHEIGPRAVPMFIATMMILLGALIAFVAMRFNSIENGNASADDDIYEEDDYGFADADITRVFSVIGCGIVYIIIFIAAGYFVATMASLFLIMVAFGNRNPRTLILVPVIGTAVYQYVFMGLMGLHDPAGELLDVTALTNLISGN